MFDSTTNTIILGICALFLVLVAVLSLINRSKNLDQTMVSFNGRMEPAWWNQAREVRLSTSTGGWTVPILVRTYSANAADTTFQDEAIVLVKHGYRLTTQSGAGGHIHAGRLILTGGLSVLGGPDAIRSKGSITVTYQKTRAADSEPAQERRPCWQCRELVVVGAMKCRFCGADLTAQR